MDISALWKDVRAELRNQLGDETWLAYFRESALRSLDGRHLAVCTPDVVSALFVEKNFRGLIEDCVHSLSGLPFELSFVHDAGVAAADPDQTEQLLLFGNTDRATSASRSVKQVADAAPSRASILQRAMDCRLNASQNFESFVTGSTNEFAVAAARAVAEHPAARFNPLFLYSAPGLGKTHLLHALGLAALEINPTLRVRYVRGETFVNEFIEAVRNEEMRDFRQRNRAEIDILLLDDIQFLEAKERTQVEFFHTFNDLFESNRQVVITSDRTPGDLRALDERLRSRCSQGLVVDIQPPDLETRIAILKRRAAALNFHVPADVIEYIAQNVRTNVRELHGALLRIGARAAFNRRPVNVDTAREELARVVAADTSRISPDAIVQLVCAALGVTPKDIKGRKRIARIAVPRKVAMFLARKHTSLSYPELGEFFGGRDHTTVLAAVRSVEEAIAAQDPLASRIEQIERRIEQR